jgi:hypothetical protein
MRTTAIGRAAFLAGFATVLAVTFACVDRLPDQDLRILAAPPVERLSATLLWDDYQKDRAAADRRYRGQAIVITGTVTASGSGEPGQRFVVFGRTDGPGAVRAHLLDEQSTAILAAVKTSPRATLKCFCEGLTDVVVLRSCVNP